MATPITPKEHYKQQVLQIKHQAIIAAVNQLLAGKGFDHMTVDEVAQLAGMSKASLYKLYASKEDLAAAAMVQVLDLALDLVNQLREDTRISPLEKLMRMTRWAMQTKLEGEMPSLPAQNSYLSAALQNHEPYMERLFDLSMKLGVWVGEAQNAGDIKPELPAEFVLYNLYARACDPVLEVMKATGNYENSQILDWLLLVHFEGMRN